jgi:hypothetical protein
LLQRLAQSPRDLPAEWCPILRLLQFVDLPNVFAATDPPCTEKPCPNSYAYAYDESSKTALWTCDSKLSADYVVTFCP